MINLANNKRIAKNTIILYIRMLVMIIISFFTARITIQVLGVEDYGIMNVVGGLLSVTGIITGSLSSAIQRFFSFELGKKNINGYRRVFSMTLSIYIIVAIFTIILGEIIGPWVINNYLIIPKDRLVAANWLYQSSIITFALSLLSTPYTASLIANEKMNIYAYMAFYDAGTKLLVVLFLYISTIDKLITIAFLSVITGVIGCLIYYLYCHCKLIVCRYSPIWDKKLLGHLLSYIGWNLFGSTTGTLNNWGMSILLNLFFGPTINAAKGIGDVVNNTVTSFCTNFYQAAAPQIIKTYAAGDCEYSKQLVCKSTKFSFFLLLMMSVPAILLMKDILIIWLGAKVVTTEMVSFARMMLVFSLVCILEQPITTIIRATGDIKCYQISVGIITLLTLPLAYLFFKLNFDAIYSVISMIILYLIAQIVRMKIVNDQVGLTYEEYGKFVLIPIIKVLFTIVFISIGFTFLFHGLWQRMFGIGLSSIFISLFSIYTLGLTGNERYQIRTYFKNRIK